MDVGAGAGRHQDPSRAVEFSRKTGRSGPGCGGEKRDFLLRGLIPAGKDGLLGDLDLLLERNQVRR